MDMDIGGNVVAAAVMSSTNSSVHRPNSNSQYSVPMSSSSLWSQIYHQTERALGHLFSILNHDWVKGRNYTYGATANTRNGPVLGKTFTLEPGERQVSAFLGIPYARAGTFKGRFQKPFPVEPWHEPLDCTRYGPRAVQNDMFWDTYITPIRQDEANCLHISVFAPEWESTEFKKSGRPVMVFVHGGGFLIHSAVNYGDWNICQNLCIFDVIVCVVQYRLGALGFLSTGDARCPGNFGLWDQLAAFKWVQENIGAFGGDPSNVTAFGQSAGAAAIDLLSLSPYSKGLFKRVILMGGNASTDWAVVPPGRTLNAAVRLAKRAGWKGPETDVDSLLEFLRSAPAHRIAAPLIGKSAFNRHKKGLEFCPVVDGDLIPAPVEQLRRQMDWPLEVIIGGTEYEALLFVALGRSQANLASLQRLLQIYIPQEIFPNAPDLRRECEALYLENMDKDDPLQVANAFLRLHSDLMMNNSVQRYCRAMSTRHRIYLYNMNFFNRDGFGFVGLRMPFFAATHCHDLRYLFGKGLYAKFRPNWDDRQMMTLIGAFFTNFTKYGNPNTHLRPILRESDGKEKELESNGVEKCCCPPWQDQQHTHTVPSELATSDLWRPIDANDTFRHLELCLEPTMRPDYQGRRYTRFWEALDEQVQMKK